MTVSSVGPKQVPIAYSRALPPPSPLPPSGKTGTQSDPQGLRVNPSQEVGTPSQQLGRLIDRVI